MLKLMQKSTKLADLLDLLQLSARSHGFTDTQWAARAGVRKETLSRLRRKDTCDLTTLVALSRAVGAELGLVSVRPPRSTPDGHFPATVDREYEERLLELCASRTLNDGRWSALGPRYFMAGLAVMLASMPQFDRRGLLALAERLHPGVSEPVVFNRWLERSPVRPSRFLPLLDSHLEHAKA
jgi:hypothetical protein